MKIKFIYINILVKIIEGYRYIIVPGMGGSVLYHHLDDKRKIWPPTFPMNFKEIELNDKFEIPKPQEKRIGPISSIQIDTPIVYAFTKNTYYSQLIDNLKINNHQVYAFPYDFRYILFESYKNILYEQYEKFIREDDKGDFRIICHSLGGIIFQDFVLEMKERNRKDILEKIKKIYYISVPFGGVPHSLHCILDGIDNERGIILEKNNINVNMISTKFKNIHRFSGLYLTLPIENFGPIYRKEEKWYDNKDMINLIKENKIAKDYYELSERWIKNRKKSINEIEQIIIYGTNIMTTPICLDYESRIILNGDGDGIVPKSSLIYPIKNWKNKPKEVNIVNMEHSKINNSPILWKIITNEKK